MGQNDKLQLFEDKRIRTAWDEEKEEWYFSVVDVVAVLTDSENPRRYWSDLKRKLNAEGASEVYEKIVQLKLLAPDGKKRLTDVADTEQLLRIIQSIPSPKAEPFKRWLAQVVVYPQVFYTPKLHNASSQDCVSGVKVIKSERSHSRILHRAFRV